MTATPSIRIMHNIWWQASGYVIVLQLVQYRVIVNAISGSNDVMPLKGYSVFHVRSVLSFSLNYKITIMRM